MLEGKECKYIQINAHIIPLSDFSFENIGRASYPIMHHNVLLSAFYFQDFCDRRIAFNNRVGGLASMGYLFFGHPRVTAGMSHYDLLESIVSDRFGLVLTWQGHSTADLFQTVKSYIFETTRFQTCRILEVDRNVAGDVIKRVRGGDLMLFDAVCIHLNQNEDILFLSSLLKGILGKFLRA
jgi:hypothetical protein